jgi:hypothetical protein
MAMLCQVYTLENVGVVKTTLCHCLAPALMLLVLDRHHVFRWSEGHSPIQFPSQFSFVFKYD